MTVTEAGWQAFFAHPEYPRLVSGILTEERTRAELAAIRRAAGLAPGTAVLDLGCGQGRLSVPLARAGCRVTALDSSPELLSRAAGAAAAADVPIEFVRADMGDLADVGKYDVVLNIGTAFGYAADADHDRTLAAVHRALRPGGVLLLDTENRERLVRHESSMTFDRLGTTVRCDRSYDPATGRWHEALSWEHEGRAEHAGYTLRLYTVPELSAALRRAGFTAVDAWGDLSGTPYRMDSPRTVLRARR
ncbi:SAM-dependent methyltransferase [Jidongwangia harbinensis]|uniref:SAM-dependent methyltransferase n=1 Tax=Jidongwangia harbinensis TaxID=2878561 RepID=UPI001CDA3C96|nr:class I SAM-dependent methyltransferase [Jidongwangia harbinensis]MCA2218284.1 class I SAM-dependent methyltransferase [Jidongwangia harbinensis]